MEPMVLKGRCNICGLAGLIGRNLFQCDVDIFKELLYVTSLRGMHSTGVMGARETKKGWTWAIEKETLSAPEFIKKHEHSVFDSHHKCDIFMGHCRDATVGEINEENSHPFDTERLIGAHNGTLREYKYRSDKTKTDSQMMFEAMSKEGILPVLQDLHALSAYAVSIFDKQTGELYLARNYHRPLYVALGTQFSLCIWGSDYRMLQLVADRGRLPVEVFQLEPNVLHTLNLDKIDRYDDKKHNVPWTSTEITPKGTDYDDDSWTNQELMKKYGYIS